MTASDVTPIGERERHLLHPGDKVLDVREFCRQPATVMRQLPWDSPEHQKHWRDEPFYEIEYPGGAREVVPHSGLSREWSFGPLAE